MSKPSKTFVIGHRGASGYAPENTLAAMAQAHSTGLTHVEFDVKLAKCGIPILMHDETLDRTTAGQGRVRDYDYPFISQLDAGSWFNPLYAGEKVPTLEEMLSFLKQTGMKSIIELKPCFGTEKTLAKTVVDLLAKQGIASNEHLISSFSRGILEEVRRLSPHQSLALGIDSWTFFRGASWMDFARDLGCQSIHLNQALLSQKKVDKVKGKGFAIYSYTVNNPERAAELFDWGVDAVFSDFPDKIQGK